MQMQGRNNIHADHVDIPLRELMRFAAEHYTAAGGRYFDVFVRKVFVAQIALKIDFKTHRPDEKALYPTDRFKL